MRYIKDIIKYFTFITTGIIILFIVLMLIQGDKELCLSTLIEIPCAGLATSVVTVFLYPFEEQKVFFLRILLHYLALCIIMITMGKLFGWIRLNIGGILLMMLSVAVIYIFTFGVTYITSKNEAYEMNQALKSKNRNDV